MSIPWLKELEEKVRATSDRLNNLREENETLKARVVELEKLLETSPDSTEREAWAEERTDIRQRVESLVEHLEKLLEDE